MRHLTDQQVREFLVYFRTVAQLAEKATARMDELLKDVEAVEQLVVSLAERVAKLETSHEPWQ